MVQLNRSSSRSIGILLLNRKSNLRYPIINSTFLYFYVPSRSFMIRLLRAKFERLFTQKDFTYIHTRFKISLSNLEIKKIV